MRKVKFCRDRFEESRYKELLSQIYSANDPQKISVNLHPEQLMLVSGVRCALEALENREDHLTNELLNRDTIEDCCGAWAVLKKLQLFVNDMVQYANQFTRQGMGNYIKFLPEQGRQVINEPFGSDLVCMDARNYRAARAIWNLSKNGLGHAKESVKGQGVSHG
ncbi:hypothetical protein [Cyclobacterium xiamenense]|uniref:hypothetical protein n=1 Tax=Cyclobacterium xiamenense TaxID=1297121 RepID=UPI0012B8CB88|nr:hypothetical protein [Cyclobacterium xiamenense]